ncbi:Uncharacterized protein TCM_014044 [Theobroma cacao]|uniref:HAT C-terminal dimerisation domain-containing protein n=1 Tax=Theobroma cacao TaxID=3641 RepID=A0A061FYC7_THECC|nr:Uncharacterized protein TCM_014044 [Theobroma cacao]
MRRLLRSCPGKMCLTTNTWISIQRINYICLITHFIDNDWKLQKRILNFCPITSHKGKAISKAITLKFQRAFTSFELCDNSYIPELIRLGDGVPDDRDWVNVMRISSFLREFYDLTLSVLGTSGGCSDSVASTLIGKDTKRTKKRLDRFKTHQLNTRSKELKTELEKYLSELVDDGGFDDDKFDVLMWWKLNQFRFPVVVAIAHDVLAVPVSTIASEYAFSTGERVLDAYRSSLTPKVVQALICTQDWLHGLARGDPDLIEDDLDELDKLDFDNYFIYNLIYLICQKLIYHICYFIF